LDFTLLRKSAERLRLATAAFDRVFGQKKIAGTSDQYRILPGEERAWKEHLLRVRDLYAAMEGARSPSGSRWRFEPAANRYDIVDGDDNVSSASEFRLAANIDGAIRITEYADKDWREYFAECFSLYVMDPQALEWLRPTIYTYFTKHFPR
jgi:hypothetical protein